MGEMGLLALFVGGAIAIVGGAVNGSIPAAIAGGLIFVGGSILLATAFYIAAK